MVCWCCNDNNNSSNNRNKKHHQNDENTQQHTGNNTFQAPSQIKMIRDGEPITILDEDIQAVKAWRDSRNAAAAIVVVPRNSFFTKTRRYHTPPPTQHSHGPVLIPETSFQLKLPESSNPNMATLDNSMEKDQHTTVMSSLKDTETNLAPMSSNTSSSSDTNTATDSQTMSTVSLLSSTQYPTIHSQALDNSCLTKINTIATEEMVTTTVLENTPTSSHTTTSPRIKSPTIVPVTTSSPVANGQRPRSLSTESNSSHSSSVVVKSSSIQSKVIVSEIHQHDKLLENGENVYIQKPPMTPSETSIKSVKHVSDTLRSDPVVGHNHSQGMSNHTQNQSLEDENTTNDSESNSPTSATTTTGTSTSTTTPLTMQRNKAIAVYAIDETNQYTFQILGTSGISLKVLTPRVLEALRGFLPISIAEDNFWLKYSSHRDGGSLIKLLSTIRTAKHTILAVETMTGHVFGVFCSIPWRVQHSWFGSRESFLWRLKHSRHRSNNDNRCHINDNEMEVYPYTGHDDLVQFATNKTIAVGGGTWDNNEGNPFPQEPTGIGFSIDGDLLGGETNSCATFASPRLCGLLAHDTEFEIHSIEVWTLTQCNTVEEAEILETQKFFAESG